MAEAPDRLTGLRRRPQDGFQIAELDLVERGMGDLIGARQSGGVEVRHARLPADDDLLARARQLAIDLIGADPALQRTGESAPPGARGGTVSAGGGALSGG